MLEHHQQSQKKSKSHDKKNKQSLGKSSSSGQS